MGVTARRWVVVVSMLVAFVMILPGLNQGSEHVAAQDSGEDVTVDIQDFAFDSDRIEIPVGTTVVWTNRGDAPHTVTADDESFGSDTLNNGDTFRFTFTEVGEFAYHCAIHPRMTGVIVVTDAAEEATEEPEATEESTEEATEEPTEEATEEPTEEATEEADVDLSDASLVGSATEYAGQIEIRGTDLTIYGYLTNIAGIEKARLFTDSDPANWNESTARFTFFGSGSATSVTAVGESVRAITADVVAQFFLNTGGGGTFENPESFLSGTEVAAADLTFHYVATVIDEDTELIVGDASLTWTNNEPFALGDEVFQFGRVDGVHRLSYSGSLAGDDNLRTITLAGSSVAISTDDDDDDLATPEASDDSDGDDNAADEVTLDLDELNDSGMSGTATLRADGETTVVTLALDGATGDHPAHIHSGTCNDLDPNPAFPLLDVDASGESETTVEISLVDLESEPFAINVHKSIDEIGVYVACGNIGSES